MALAILLRSRFGTRRMAMHPLSTKYFMARSSTPLVVITTLTPASKKRSMRFYNETQLHEIFVAALRSEVCQTHKLRSADEVLHGEVIDTLGGHHNVDTGVQKRSMRFYNETQLQEVFMADLGSEVRHTHKLRSETPLPTKYFMPRSSTPWVVITTLTPAPKKSSMRFYVRMKAQKHT